MATLSTGAPADGAGRGPVQPDVARRAVQWFLDLQGPDVAPGLRAEWLRWRSADPEHERAWLRIEAVSGRFHLAPSEVSAAVTSAAAHGLLDAQTRGARRRTLKALGLMLLGAGGAALVVRSTPWREMLADHRTAVGERRTVSLSDGSVVLLDTATSITVRYTAMERRVVLVAGRIQLTSGGDPVRRAGQPGSARPLLVETAEGEALALGTRFTVRQDAGSSVVAVHEGMVEVRPWGEGRPATLLRPGERTRFSAHAVEPAMPFDPRVSAWTQGSIVAVAMRLDDFLAELARYSSLPIVCDPRVGDRRLSGAYPVDQRDRVLETLAGVLGLEVRTVTRFPGRQSIEIGPAGSPPQAGDGPVRFRGARVS